MCMDPMSSTALKLITKYPILDVITNDYNYVLYIADNFHGRADLHKNVPQFFSLRKSP